MPTLDLGDSGDWDGTNPASPFDSGWRTRIPPGWIQFADGTYGPPNRPSPFDQGWQTCTARVPGLPAPTAGPGMPAAQPQGGNPFTTPYQTPQGGNELLRPGGGIQVTNQAGQPIGGPTAPPGGAGIISSLLGNMNPYAKAAIAAAGVMAPRPAAGPAAPTNMWNQRPSGVGGLPGPQVTNPATPPFRYDPLSSAQTGLPYQPPSGPGGGIGSDARIPLAGPSGRNAQPQTPYPPPRPRTPAATATAPPAAPSMPFAQIARQNMSAAGNARGGGGPMMMSALDLSRLFQRARQ